MKDPEPEVTAPPATAPASEPVPPPEVEADVDPAPAAAWAQPDDLPPARVADARPAPAGVPMWVIKAALVPPGWLFILYINRWHVTTPTVVLLMGWLALVLTAMWAVHMAIATVDDTEDDWFRARGRRDDLEREKRSLLKAIKEIEFDRETGKMSAADATELIATYRAKAIEVIKSLEALDGKAAEGSPRERVLAELRARAAVDRAGKASKAKKAGKGKGRPAGSAAGDAEDAS